MSILATITLVWAGVYAYLAVYYVVLWVRRRTDREFLAFGLVCAATVVYTVGAALITDAESTAEGARALQLQFAGAAGIVGFFTDFATSLVGRPARRTVVAGYVVAGVGLVLDASGLFFDPSQPTPPSTWGFSWAPDYHEALLTPIGQAYLVVGFGFFGYALFLLAAAARRDRDARLVLLTSGLWALGALHDAVMHVTAGRSVYLAEHVGMLSTLAVSWILLGRFIRASDELAERTRELQRSYTELRAAQEELLRKEQLATVGELSAVIAHEVRNPIAIIKNAVSGLRRATLADTDRSVLLGILDEEAERLNRLVGDLLTFARPLAPQSRRVALAELVQRALELARKASPGNVKIDLDVSLGGGPAHVHCDPDLFRQALVNVAENALQAMPAGGTLTVRADAALLGDEEAVALRIRDTGEGMDTLVRSKARDPFFTTRPAGTGLGLAIVDRVVRAHGGRVEIESSHGAGTTVTLTLPTHRQSLPPHGAA